jgi:hypothetical protein
VDEQEDKKQELSRLLTLYRKGHISEKLLLEQMAEIDGPQGPSHDSRALSRSALRELLDGYRAAEASGAQTLGAWAAHSDDAALVGGLRTAAAREAKHAALLEQRLRELGGQPRAVLPGWLADYNSRIADEDVPDVERLALLVERFPDIDQATRPLMVAIEAIEDDDLTKELLRTICADERSTLEWVHSAYAVRRPAAIAVGAVSEEG